MSLGWEVGGLGSWEGVNNCKSGEDEKEFKSLLCLVKRKSDPRKKMDRGTPFFFLAFAFCLPR